MIKNILFFLIIGITTAMGQSNFDQWDQILKSTVSNTGVVDYSKLNAQHKGQISQLASEIAKVKVSELSKNDEFAFWMNVYNLSTVQLILNNWPVKSIKDIANGEPWDLKWIKVNGEVLSLNQIEHDIIRKKFKDARIHFAVNCAAKSCPPLLNAAYVGSKVDKQLEQQTKKFINNPSYNTIAKNNAEVTQLMNWYKVDFGDIITYINKYSATKVAPNAAISYKDYDWALNGK